MGLQHGGLEAQDQMNNAMTAEQQRELKNGLILVQLRRYWRIFCIAMGIFYFLKMWLFEGATILQAAGLSAVFWAIIYVIILYLFLYILAFRVLQVFFYLRDLFGGNKETRL